MYKKTILCVLIFFCFFIFGCAKKENLPVEPPQNSEHFVSDESGVSIPAVKKLSFYKNDAYQYTLEYPADWFFTDDACCPPPPEFVMFNNISPKKDVFSRQQMSEDALSLNISCLYEGKIDDIGEVQSQKKDGVKNENTTINGFPAIKFIQPIYPDRLDENVLSYYVVNGEKGCRIVYSDKCSVCDTILHSFKFIK